MKQGQFFNKFSQNSICANQKGQAVVEYVLLLVVIVSMLFAAQGVFKGVNAFIGDYVGKYFICLLDHGELPAQGVVNEDPANLKLDNHKGQSPKCLAQFSIASGATLVGGGSSVSGGSNLNAGQNGKNRNNGQNSSNGKNGGSSKSKSSSSSKSGSSGGNDSDSESGSSMRSSSAYAGGRIARSKSGSGIADGATDGSSGKTRIIDEEPKVESAFGRADWDGWSRSQSKPTRYKAIVSGQIFDEVTKNSKRESRQPVTKKISKATVEEGFRPGPRRNAFVPPERKPANLSEDKDTEFGFGSLLKWLMIAGMVVALIVFFGGQVMNYSNSD